MASIEQRASGKWRVQIRRQGYRPLSRSFDTKQAARDWASEVEGKILIGQLIDVGEGRRTTLGEALERYLAEETPTKRGAKQERQRIQQWLSDQLSSRPLASIRSTDIARWRSEQQAAGKAPSTIRNALTIISQVYRTAASEWQMESLRNPVSGVRLPKLRPGRDRRLGLGEEERLIEAAGRVGGPWLRSAIVVAIETAMRQGELLSLRWEVIQGHQALLRTTKNGRPRAVPLSSRARAVLAELPRSIGGMVFPITAPALDKRWRRVCAVAGIEGLRWHDLRHEAVSRLFEKGLTTEEVMQMSGHRTYAMLARYTHLRTDMWAAKLG